MDRKVELQVIEVTESQEQVGAYALLLSEVDGNRKMPIIIGPSEAQAIVVCLTHAKTPRPLTHDLFATTLQALNVKLMRVLIYRAFDGVFYSYIYLRHGEELLRIDSRTSDAIALAVRMKTPIMIYDSILDQECIKTAIDLDIPETRQASAKRELTVEDLERKLETAIDEENYEMAARLRDEIKKRKAAAENKDDAAEAPGEE